jgi:hypothetical protein
MLLLLNFVKIGYIRLYNVKGFLALCGLSFLSQIYKFGLLICINMLFQFSTLEKHKKDLSFLLMHRKEQFQANFLQN